MTAIKRALSNVFLVLSLPAVLAAVVGGCAALYEHRAIYFIVPGVALMLFSGLAVWLDPDSFCPDESKES